MSRIKDAVKEKDRVVRKIGEISQAAPQVDEGSVVMAIYRQNLYLAELLDAQDETNRLLRELISNQKGQA